MLDYALNFYNSYTIIFYILLIIAVILEWPITILILCLLAPKFWFSFIFILIFAFLWEFLWDLMHYFIWRFFKKNIFKDKNFVFFEKIEKKLEKHSLFDKLVVIKYTPPITSIWLIYMWFQKIDIKKFIKNIFIFSVLNSILIVFIWFNFWKYFVNSNDFKYLIIWILISFLLVYLLLKLITSYFIKNILDEK